VPRDALGFVSVRVADIWNQPEVKQAQMLIGMMAPALAEAEKATGMTLGDLERFTVVFPTQDTSNAFAIVAASKPYDQQKILATFFPQAQPRSAEGKSYHVAGAGAVAFLNDRIAVMCAASAMPALLKRSSQAGGNGALAEPLKLAESKKYPIVAAAIPPAERLQGLKKEPPPPDLPAELRAEWEPAKSFLDMQMVTLTIEASQQINLDVKFPDDARAAKAQAATKSIVAKGRQQLQSVRKQLARGPQAAQVGAMFDQVDQMLQTMPIEQKGSLVHISIPTNKIQGGSAIMLSMLVPAIQKIRQSATRTTGSNNLSQLGLAMINYSQSNRGQLPTASVGGGLSWRVALLPYLEQGELYKQFHLNEPWDSEHNKKLLPLMPKVFESPGKKPLTPHSTFYQVFTGPKTPFTGQQGTRYPLGFQDGTSNTFLIVEGARAVPWTKPEDIPFDGNNVPPLGGAFPGGFWAVLADGSVNWFDLRKVSPATLKAAITPSGGEPLGADWPGGRR
jgi:hypothetical protein